jgi:hypothetical protein
MSEPVWGLVKNGVVLLQEPLPEGVLVRVQVVTHIDPVEFTPEEQAEFDAWERASDEALVNLDRQLREEEEHDQG